MTDSPQATPPPVIGQDFMTDSSLATLTLALQREAHTEARSGATSSRAPERRGVGAYYAPIATRGLEPTAAP